MSNVLEQDCENWTELASEFPHEMAVVFEMMDETAE